MKNLIVAALLLAACGPRLSTVWPVTPDVARSSSFDLATTHADHSTDHGTAWIVDHHHLVTAASRCDPNGVHSIAVSHQVALVASTDELCLLSSTEDLGNPLILADTTPHGARRIMRVVDYGAPIGAAVVATWQGDDTWGTGPKPTRSGVIGLVLEPGKYVGLRGLKGFLSRNHIDWHDEPALPGPYDYAGEQGGPYWEP